MATSLQQHNKNGKHPIDPKGWKDLGAPIDQEHRARICGIVARRERIRAYVLMENALANTPYNKLPRTIVDQETKEVYVVTPGELPQASPNGGIQPSLKGGIQTDFDYD